MNQILLVHDHQASPGLRRSVLERAGWEVRATSSSEECLAWLRAAEPALVILDVLLDGGTGFDLCQRIRDHHPAERVPIVLGCHVYREPEHRAEAERVGAQAYLPLPVEPEELLAVVARLTGERQGVRAA